MVDIDIHDGIATLRLNRPPVNAVNLDLLRAADGELRGIAARNDLRALIITGAGKAFCAGLDLKDVPTYTPALRYRTQGRCVQRILGGPVQRDTDLNDDAHRRQEDQAEGRLAILRRFVGGSEREGPCRLGYCSPAAVSTSRRSPSLIQKPAVTTS